MPLTQDKRLVAVGTPLGGDKLVFWRMQAKESLGRLFEFQLEMLSEDEAIALEDVLGKNITVRLEMPNGSTRYFNGNVSRFGQVGGHQRHFIYRATLHPWFWFLTRTSDCRIFQETKVPDIIQSIFRERGFTDFQNKLNGSYRTWDYCVQYRETDFNFISRLMEQEGIYYYFTHENGKHILVLSDSYSSHQPYPGYETLPYYPPDRHRRRERDHIYAWSVSQQVQPGIYALNDYDFVVPRKNLRSQLAMPKSHAQANFEIYDYPGEYTQLSDGNQYSRVRLEELHAQHEVIEGEGDAQGLAVGSLFSLTNCPREDQNRQYLLVNATHALRSDIYESSVNKEEQAPPYTCNFTVINAQQPFRTPRSTPKPVVQGPQTAVVVGKAGEEIWTDEHARIKCQFHWDRYGTADEKSSCWIRVAQIWAGKQWGSMFIPRIGQEVIVEFLEGDPDRPIITGRFYNGSNMPPYGLPANATISALRSNSSKGGAGCNEIRLEDKKGSEEFFLHAEKDHHVRVKNESYEWIGKDRHLIVKKKQTELVEEDKHSIVKGDQNNKVDGTLSLTVGADLQEKIGSKHALDAGQEIHLKAGMKVVVQAGTQISLKVGGNHVTIDNSGVTIKGSMVKINSGGSAGSGSGSSPTTPEQAKEANNTTPGQIASTSATPIQKPGGSLDSVTVNSYQIQQSKVLGSAAESGVPFCEKCAEK